MSKTSRPNFASGKLKSCNTFHFATLSTHAIHCYSSFGDELCSLNNNLKQGCPTQNEPRATIGNTTQVGGCKHYTYNEIIIHIADFD
jgi:hypothetical protein